MWVESTMSRRPTEVPWEGRGQDAKEARIPCRKKAGQLGRLAWSREELEGAPGGGSLGTEFQHRLLARLS